MNDFYYHYILLNINYIKGGNNLKYNNYYFKNINRKNQKKYFCFNNKTKLINKIFIFNIFSLKKINVMICF